MKYSSDINSDAFKHFTNDQKIHIIKKDGSNLLTTYSQVVWTDVLGWAVSSKQDLAKGNNPDRLSVDQVGKDYRLLDEDEIIDNGNNKRYAFAQVWISSLKEWSSSLSVAANKAFTFRTKLSRNQVNFLDKGYKPWNGTGSAPQPTGRVWYVMRRFSDCFIDDADKLRWSHDYTGSDIVLYKEEPIRNNDDIVSSSTPWSHATCPPLGFEIVHKKSKSRHIIGATCPNESGCYIMAYGYISWENLYKFYECVDGSPCGISFKKT